MLDGDGFTGERRGLTITGRDSFAFVGFAFGGFAESEKRIAAYRAREPKWGEGESPRLDSRVIARMQLKWIDGESHE